MHRTFAVIALCCSCALALAQWSSDPAANLALADGSGEQVQPKVRATSDGGCYVSWYDNATGGYDLTLQRLDAAGVEQWAHGGVLIADLSQSSTQDYDLRVDASGNALLAFRDDRSGATLVTAQKISAAGAPLWGASGVQLAGSAGGNQPRCCMLSDGSTVVGWTQSASPATFVIQKIDAAGASVWAAPGVAVSEPSRPCTLSDLQPGDAGSVVALWVRAAGTPIFSAKHLHTQRFDTAGAASWNGGAPVVVFDATSLQNGYFPNFLPDGRGGAVYGWYENGGPRNAYIQHITAAGALRYPAPLAAAAPTADRIRVSAALAYDPARDETFLGWTESTAPSQNAWGLRAQKFDGPGERLWTEAGTELLAVNASQSSFARVVADGAGGCSFFAFDARGATAGVVVGGAFTASGAPAWPGQPLEVSSVVSGKSRLDAARSADGAALLAWGDGRNGPADIYAQRVNANGALGNPPPLCPTDLDDDGDFSNGGNPDGGVTIDDLLYYLSAFELGDIAADLDDGSGRGLPDGGVTIDDLLYVLLGFERGC